MNSKEKLLNSLPKDVREFIESKSKWIAEKEKIPVNLSPNKRIYCNECKKETNHICKYHSCKYLLLSTDKNYAFLNTFGNRLWACAGCDWFSLETYLNTESFVSENVSADLDKDDYLDEDPDPDTTSLFYPKRTKHNIVAKPYSHLPAPLNSIYKEVITAYNEEVPTLCAIGIRALIEGICFDQEITGGNLEKKIEGLISILPKNIVENLHNLRFMGNEAAHELSAPPQQELQLAIEICDDLLNYLYELDYKANFLAKMRNQKESPIKSLGKGDNFRVTIWCGEFP